MAVIVKIANILVKNKASNEDVANYLESLGDSWRRFSDGELKASNDKNTRSLGGQQPRSLPGDDDEMEGSMSMDSILSRFSNFNSESQKRNPSNDFDDDDDEDEDEEGDEDKDHSHEGGAGEAKASTTAAIDALLKERDTEYKHSDTPRLAEAPPLVKDFVDNNYWKVDLY
jgi:cobalamin biosynthesis protein CobT